MRLVMAKNPGLPSITSHRVSMPSPIAVATSPRSISATPPVAAALMFQMVRPRKRSRVVSANWENWENRAPPMMASNRSAMVGVTLASRMLPPREPASPVQFVVDWAVLAVGERVAACSARAAMTRQSPLLGGARHPALEGGGGLLQLVPAGEQVHLARRLRGSRRRGRTPGRDQLE